MVVICIRSIFSIKTDLLSAVTNFTSYCTIYIQGVFMAYCQAKYYYKKTGAGSRASTQWAGKLNAESETMLMQKLRKKHPGCEIELISIKWK